MVGSRRSYWAARWELSGGSGGRGRGHGGGRGRGGGRGLNISEVAGVVWEAGRQRCNTEGRSGGVVWFFLPRGGDV
jgi:hypothetical protein